MKKLLTCLFVSSLLMGMSGCSLQPASSRNCLSIMKAVNDSNIVHADPVCRLWYQIETSLFSDGDGDGSGDLAGVYNYLDYFSDGDPETSDQDLNMTGLFLNELIQTGTLNAVVDYYTINPDYGNVSDLARLCSEAGKRGMDVMMTLDLTTISLESTLFTSLEEAAAKVDKLKDIDYEYTGLFYLSDESGKDMYPLKDTKFYYQAAADSTTPLINQDNPAWRQLISNVVSYYMNLGIKGFYLPNTSSIFPGDKDKNQAFLTWFNKLVKDIDPYATIAASSDSYVNNLNDLGIYISQNDFAGAEGYISKAVTGAMNTLQLADALADQNTMASYFLTGQGTNMDLLKSASREKEVKMALALLVLMSGQVFISAGDEIGLPNSEISFISDALDEEKGSQIDLTFGSLKAQRENPDSVLNFLMQAIRLRDSFTAISQGQTTILNDLCTESLLVLKKDTDESSAVIVFNLSNTVSSMDTSGILIHDLPAELGGVLVCEPDEVTLEDNVLSLPAYSAAVLK